MYLQTRKRLDSSICPQLRRVGSPACDSTITRLTATLAGVSDEYHASGVRYRIDSPFLVVEHDEGGATESVLLDEVTEVRLTLVQGMGMCTLATSSGQKLTIPGWHGTAANPVHQVEEYTDFVRSLHDELASAAPKARFVAGSNLVYVLSMLLLVMALLAALGGILLTFRAVTRHGVSLEALFPMLALTPLGVVTAAGAARRGRAKSYDPVNPPEAFLPDTR